MGKPHNVKQQQMYIQTLRQKDKHKMPEHRRVESMKNIFNHNLDPVIKEATM